MLPETPPSVPMYARNDDHNNCLLHHWNKDKKNLHLVNKKATTTAPPYINIPKYP